MWNLILEHYTGKFEVNIFYGKRKLIKNSIKYNNIKNNLKIYKKLRKFENLYQKTKINTKIYQKMKKLQKT